MYQEFTDEELAALLKKSDRAAFSEIYNRYKGLLYVHAYRKLWNQQEADDIIHDLFAGLWDKREEFEISGYLSGYLYTATRNRVFRLMSRKSLESGYISSLQVSINKGDCVTDYRVRENQLAAIIEKEIALLPPKMREVFEMSRKAGMSHREIARELNISEETVKKHVHHALKTLRVKLGIFMFLFFLFNN